MARRPVCRHRIRCPDAVPTGCAGTGFPMDGRLTAAGKGTAAALPAPQPYCPRHRPYGEKRAVTHGCGNFSCHHSPLASHSAEQPRAGLE